jgi:hypothetical protein
MSPHSFTDDDLKTLHDWNVGLVRAQITRNWGNPAPIAILRIRQVAGRQLDHLEDVFRRARPYGIKFVVDLHSPPGGRDETRDMNMFYEKKYADHFRRGLEEDRRPVQGKSLGVGL